MYGNINLEDVKPDEIHTYGGEYRYVDGTELSIYGIQIGDLSIELNPEAAVKVCEKLAEHLKINGRKIKI